jgi:hypothetical protein
MRFRKFLKLKLARDKKSKSRNLLATPLRGCEKGKNEERKRERERKGMGLSYFGSLSLNFSIYKLWKNSNWT